MCMVGIKPVSDALGRVNKLEVQSLEELGRPRVDVVVNCSGVFRDLFVNQVPLHYFTWCARAGRGGGGGGSVLSARAIVAACARALELHACAASAWGLHVLAWKAE